MDINFVYLLIGCNDAQLLGIIYHVIFGKLFLGLTKYSKFVIFVSLRIFQGPIDVFDSLLLYQIFIVVCFQDKVNFMLIVQLQDLLVCLFDTNLRIISIISEEGDYLMMEESKQCLQQQLDSYDHDGEGQQFNHQEHPALIDHHYDIAMSNKNCVDFMINTQDNMAQLLTIIPNTQLGEQVPNDQDKINWRNQSWIRNEQQPNFISNSNALMMQILWNRNHYLDQYDLKREEPQEPWIQNKNNLNKQEHYDDSISHYILQNDNHDFYLRFKTNTINQHQQIPEQCHQTPQQIRRQKVQRYLQKKQKRCFYKKITYECRKLVADKRIRLKGRFINYHKAVSELGLNPEISYESSYLKQEIKKLQANITNNINQ